MSLFWLFNLFVITATAGHKTNYSFPKDFKFGVATAAYQIEGAWNEDGKGESIWDRAIHEHPDKISNNHNADIACDSYHKYKLDIQLLKDLNVHFYRFSISWPRILPNGTIGNINPKGIQYYNDVINELIKNEIEPYVTIFHWDLPQVLQEEGGWTSRKLVDYYVDYARIVFQNFGDRVKVWMTFNEILQICEAGYSTGVFAPFIVNQGIGGYECAHTVLIAHARTFDMYNKEFRSKQNGKVGIVIDSYWHEPNYSDRETDIAAAERALVMDYGWFVNPIFTGNYPQLMIDRIRNVSLSEGFAMSRLPEFTNDQKTMLKGSYDFLGLNHYSSDKSYFAPEGAGDHPSHWADVGVIGRKETDWWKGVPWGLRKLLVWIKNTYGNPPVLITENGFPEDGLKDFNRIDYFRNYLYEVLKAIHEDGCDVIGYTVWSLMDDFEWTAGYTMRFGLYHVDFNNSSRPRTPKLSSRVYRNIVKTQHIDWNYNPELPPS